jgi:hypothetical protein
MKIEINLKACAHCKYFICETEEGIDFLDIPICGVTSRMTTEYYSCDDFLISEGVLKEIQSSFNKKFVKVLR